MSTGDSESTASHNGTKSILAPTSGFGSSFTDSSSTLFSLYLSHAEKYDKDQSETWKAGAEGTLLFTGLFAAALATFVSDSYKSLLPDSAGNTVLLLAQISQQLDGLSNGTHVPTGVSSSSLFLPSTRGARLGQSSPPASAVWVNSLWFLSLVISLFCALLATLQQRWARRYLGLTQPHVAAHKRAHIRSFFAEGVARFNVHLAVEALPALLHISVFLFLTGLVISLFTIHHTVAYIILSATVVCFLFYATITVMPILYHDSPYASPFSMLVWCISRKIAVAVVNAVNHVVYFLRKFKESFPRPVTVAQPTSSTKTSTTTPSLHGNRSGSITEDIYTSAMRPDSQRDARALGWTLDRLDEECELVQFAAGIPGFSRSIEVKEPVSILEMTLMSTLLHGDLSLHIAKLLTNAFMPEQWHSLELLPESVRNQRVSICLEALYYLPHALETLLETVASNLDRGDDVGLLLSALLSMESWLLAERLSKADTNILDPAVKFGARCMVTVIASQPPPDEQSRSLLMRHLRIDEPLLNRYLEPFDSLLLKNLNFFLINTAFDAITNENIQPYIGIVLRTVRLAKRFKFEQAVPELQNQYGRLWARIYEHATKPSGTATTRENAERLLSELSSITTNPPLPHPDPQPDPVTESSAHTSPASAGGAAASTSAHSVQRPQIPSGQWHIQPVSQPPNDVFISMVASSPVPYDTLSMTPSTNSGSG